MEKQLYTIFDTVSKEFGDVVAVNNVNEARRWFVRSASTVSIEDLQLIYIGRLSSVCDDSDTDSPIGTLFLSYYDKIEPVPLYCTYAYSEVKDDVVECRKKSFEMIQLQNSLGRDYSAPQFIQDVSKLCRWLSSNDKKFKKVK